MLNHQDSREYHSEENEERRPASREGTPAFIEIDIEAMLDEIDHDIAIVDCQLNHLNSASTQSKPSKPCISPYVLLYLIPVIYAATEACQTAMGMKNDERALAYSVIALTFMTSFAMNVTPIIDGLKESYQAIRHKKLPDDLPEISNRKKYISIAVAGGLTAYVTFSDSLQNYYFGESVPTEYEFKTPYWFIATASMTAATAINALFSEGFKNYRFIHESFSGNHHIEYANDFSRKVSPWAGRTLGSISGFFDILISAVGMTSALKIKDPGAIYALTAISLINGTSEYALQNHYVNEVTNNIIGVLATRKPTRSEIFSTSLALSIAGYVAIAAERLSLQLLTSVAELYNVEPTDGLIAANTIYAYVDAVAFTLLGGMYLYPLIYQVADRIDHKMTHIYENMVGVETLRKADIRQFSSINNEEAIPLLNQQARALAANVTPLRQYSAISNPPPRLGVSVRDEIAAHSYRPR